MPVGVVAIVLMLVVPMPAVLLDLLIGLNIAASLLILLVAMSIKRPLDFAVFPSAILIATLLRLALNVSSTRLVLSDGYAGRSSRPSATSSSAARWWSAWSCSSSSWSSSSW